MNDYRTIKLKTATGYRKLKPQDTVLEHSKSVIWLDKANGIDVMISHHLPSYNSIPEQYKDSPYNCCYASELDVYLEGKQLWIHGHTHNQQDYIQDGCRVLCNPRGYQGHETDGTLYQPKVVKFIKKVLDLD